MHPDSLIPESVATATTRKFTFGFGSESMIIDFHAAQTASVNAAVVKPNGDRLVPQQKASCLILWVSR